MRSCGWGLLLQCFCVLHWGLQQLHLWSPWRCSIWLDQTKVRDTNPNRVLLFETRFYVHLSVQNSLYWYIHMMCTTVVPPHYTHTPHLNMLYNLRHIWFAAIAVQCWRRALVKILFLSGGWLEAHLCGTMSSCMWPWKNINQFYL